MKKDDWVIHKGNLHSEALFFQSNIPTGIIIKHKTPPTKVEAATTSEAHKVFGTQSAEKEDVALR